MAKKLTRYERIGRMFTQGKGDVKLSCTEVTKKVMKGEKIDPKSSIAHYLSGSVTTILAKMVKDGILRYAKEKTPRGGHIYELQPPPDEWTKHHLRNIETLTKRLK